MLRSSRLLLATGCWLLAIQAKAQSPVTVTGLIKTPTNIAASFGTVTFKLQPFNSSIAYRVAGQVMIGPIQSVCGIDATGHLKSNADLVSACQVWGNDVISPTGTAYEIIESPNNGPGQDFTNALIQGASLDLSNLTFVPNVRVFPDLTSLTLSPLTVSLIPDQDNLYSLGSSGDRFSQAYVNNLFASSFSLIAGGSASLVKLNNTVVCDPTFSSDVGLVLADARNRLPAGGGNIDCTSLTGAQTLSTVFSQTKANIFIRWGQIQLSLCQPSASAFSWQSNNFHMQGAGQGITVFTNCVPGKNVLSSNFTLHSSLQGLEVDGISMVGGSGLSGVAALLGTDDAITVGNSTHAVSQINIHNDEMSGFGLNAVHLVNAADFNVDVFSHNNSEGVRMCGVTQGTVKGMYRDANLLNSVFTVAVGFDAFSICSLSNSDVTVQAQWKNWLDGEALMIHNLINGTIIAPQMDNVLFGIGADNSGASDMVQVVISNPNYNGSTTATGFPTNPAPANDGIFVGDSSANKLATDVSIIGGEFANCNKVNQSDTAGCIVIDSADKVTVDGVSIHDGLGCGICFASSPSTRVTVVNSPIHNIGVSVVNPGGGAVFPVGPAGGVADGIEVASAAAASSGRIQNNPIDHVTNGIDLIGSSPLLLIGPNDFLTVSGTNIVNPANATENGQQANSTFANLPAFSNGTVLYCTDCKNVVDNAATAGAACANSGAGAWAKRENGRWDCN